MLQNYVFRFIGFIEKSELFNEQIAYSFLWLSRGQYWNIGSSFVTFLVDYIQVINCFGS